MRVLVTGAKGMLGQDLVAEFGRRGWDTVATDYEELDICDPVACAEIAGGRFGKLDYLVNAAAYTAVDAAESHPREATELNAIAPGYLAQATALCQCGLVQLSTDFVFDGTKTEPYSEEDTPNPLSVYGQTKLDGEQAALASNPNTYVVRTAWLYGAQGKSFPRTMIRARQAGKQLRVVADQLGCPTSTEDLAVTLVELLERQPTPGIYHAVGPEAMSWHAFAERVLRAWSCENTVIEPIPSEAYPTPARRPAYSVLSTQKLEAAGIPPMRPVAESLASFVQRLLLESAGYPSTP